MENVGKWSLEEWCFIKNIVSFFVLFFIYTRNTIRIPNNPFAFHLIQRPKNEGGKRKKTKQKRKGKWKRSRRKKDWNKLLFLFSPLDAFLYYHSPHQTSFHGQCQWGTRLSLPGWTDRSCVPISSPSSTSAGHDPGRQHLLFQYPRRNPPPAGNCAPLRRANRLDSQSTECGEAHRIPCLEETEVQKKNSEEKSNIPSIFFWRICFEN